VGGSALVLTTGEDGRAVSPNLDCGTYFVLETKAPDGYKLPEEAVSVTVVSNALTSHVVLEVANERGAIMPETGGIGTTIFLVVGGILAVGAAILLVTKKRMNSGEEE
jgi:LPXTG-motif cell wall-anchored protein